ncbi:MAG: hypothetical protein J5J00_17200 [Deltaproteobacteria bacterium]|nr:hypothetical protein [Deltaproteobacteria bacterium]
MPIKLTRRDKRKVALDSGKESIIKELSLLMTRMGYSVRRERLKQGHGWKVLSGVCRANDNRYIFVDRKLTQSDQISFLLSKLLANAEQITEELMEGVSQETREFLAKHISGSSQSPAQEQATSA